MSYPIKEVFRSIQGEGESAGCDAVFVRFAGCNLACSFCDEDHRVKAEVSGLDLLELVENELKDVRSFKGFRVVFTGGEPLLHVDLQLVHLFLREGFRLCLETNGAMETEQAMKMSPPFELLAFHELVVSPKDVPPSKKILAAATSLKMLVCDDGEVVGGKWMDLCIEEAGSWRTREKPLSGFLQPVTPRPGDHTADIRSAASRAISLARRLHQHQPRVEWRVLPQTHVWMGLR